MALAFSNPMDDFWRRNRPMLDAMRQADQVRDALGPSFGVARDLQRMYDAARPIQDAVRHTQLVTDALRHLQEMQPAVSHLAAIRDRLMDPVGPAMSAVREALRQADVLRDMEAVTNALALADRHMELMRAVRVSDEVQSLLRTIEAQRTIMDAANAMLASVFPIEAGVTREALVAALADALDDESQTTSEGESPNLLAYVVSLALVIRERLPEVKAEWLLVHVLLPLFISLLSSGAFYMATARDGEKALLRVERAIHSNRPERHWMTAREINLREFDRKDAKVLARLSADTRLIEVDRIGAWRLVRTVRYGGDEQTGWIYYRGLRAPTSQELTPTLD